MVDKKGGLKICSVAVGFQSLALVRFRDREIGGVAAAKKQPPKLVIEKPLPIHHEHQDLLPHS